jgi:hypothetical protein
MIERVAKDHSERQQIDLCCDQGRWQITGLSPAEWIRPRIPCGTPLIPSVGNGASAAFP